MSLYDDNLRSRLSGVFILLSSIFIGIINEYKYLIMIPSVLLFIEVIRLIHFHINRK